MHGLDTVAIKVDDGSAVVPLICISQARLAVDLASGLEGGNEE